MTRNKLTNARRLAVVLVLGNLALIGVLGAVLPPPALVLLPVVALMVPLLSAAGFEAVLQREPRKPCRLARVSQAAHRRLEHAVRHAA